MSWQKNNLWLKMKTELKWAKNISFMVFGHKKFWKFSGFVKIIFIISNWNRMKTLQFVQKIFAILGFSINQPLCNRKILNGFALFSLAIPSFFMFLFRVADTIKELTDSIYITAASITIFICFVNTVFTRSKLTLFFEMLEENVNNSEFTLHNWNL